MQGEPAENYSLLEPLDAVLSPAMVTLSGSQEYISQVETVFVSVDVTGLEENYSKNLSVEVLDFNGNNITEWFTCNPSTVDVLVPVVYSQPEKSVAVSPVYVGTPALGYRITRVVVEPSTVRAFGDLDVLDNLYYVETSVIDVNGLDRTTSFTVTLLHGNNVTLSTTNATVVVQVEPESTTTVTKDLVYYENLAEGLVCTLPTVEAGDAAQWCRYLYRQFGYLCSRSLCGLRTDQWAGFLYIVGSSLTLPANISLLSITPATVEVTVEEAGLDGDASDLEDAESGDPLPEGGYGVTRSVIRLVGLRLPLAEIQSPGQEQASLARLICRRAGASTPKICWGWNGSKNRWTHGYKARPAFVYVVDATFRKSVRGERPSFPAYPNFTYWQ